MCDEDNCRKKPTHSIIIYQAFDGQTELGFCPEHIEEIQKFLRKFTGKLVIGLTNNNVPRKGVI